MNILQRLRDWRHERRILRLKTRALAALDANDKPMARLCWRLMVDAINARSAAQVERMERKFLARGVE